MRGDSGKACAAKALGRSAPAVPDKDHHGQIEDERHSLLDLAATIFIVGASTSYVGAAFRRVLARPANGRAAAGALQKFPASKGVIAAHESSND